MSKIIFSLVHTGVAPITQIRMYVLNRETFKGGHLFQFHKELLIKERICSSGSKLFPLRGQH